VEITVRHAEPDDYEAMHRIMSAPKVTAGTLQLPLQSAEAWRKRLAEPPEGLFLLVACGDGEVVGPGPMPPKASRKLPDLGESPLSEGGR
jgi:putative acetyltransferase